LTALPFKDLHVPWTWFHHIFPFSHCVCAAIHETFAFALFEDCEFGAFAAMCLPAAPDEDGVPGAKVLKVLSFFLPTSVTGVMGN